MRLVIGIIGAVSLGAFAQADPPGNASHGASPSDAATSAPATPTATASSAQPAAAATSAAPAAPDQDAQPAAPAKDARQTVVVQGTPEYDALEKHFLAEGYKLEMHNGEKMLCRREEELGSRLGGRKVCSTAQQLMVTERDAQRSVDRSMMQQNNPSGK